ncbi:MAG: putative ABC transport system permease protein [Rhodothermales bacterium]|jgi:putative ABC transport system permease protein
MPQGPAYHPPKAAASFLRWFCPDDLVEDIEGDLLEMYEVRANHWGGFQAALWYWWNVCWFMRPYVLGGREYAFRTNPDMWKSYTKIALRQMRRKPLYSGINIAGLALGIASCLIMLLFVRDELTFDSMHAQADQIHRVVERRTTESGNVSFVAETAGPVGPALGEDMPEVEATVRLLGSGSAGRFTVRHEDNERHEGEYLFAEASFLDVFDFPLLEGDQSSALDLPQTVILTESAADFYFGHRDVLGQSLETERLGDVVITGLMPDPPPNSHLQFSMILSYATLQSNDGWLEWMNDWESQGFITYLRLNGAADPGAVAARLRSFSDGHRTAESWTARAYTLQALPEIHFGSSHIERELNVGKSTRAYLYVFMAIALLIALIACINYMNLSTARAMKRAKEVGLRKVVGARRSQLVGQFLGESLMTALVALVVAVILVLLVLPGFNAFTDKSLTLDPRGSWPVLLAVLGTTIAVGLISGSYPAFYIARFQPAHVLRSLGSAGRHGRWLRDGLVVVQFALSIVLVVATIGSFRQFQYIQGKDLGFEQSRLLVLDINSSASRNGFDSMKQEFGRLADVEQVSVSSRVPGDWKAVPTIAVRTPGGMTDERLEATFMGVDADFLDTYQIALVDGRNFSEELATDSTAFLINRTAAELFGISTAAQEDPLSILDTYFGGQWNGRGYDGRVVGIVDDFHFQSLHEQIRPMVLGFRNNPIHSIDYFTLRIATDDIPGLMAQLGDIQERLDPESPIEANFLEMRLEDEYEQDRRAGFVFSVATGLALLIACFGLFGLAAFIAEQRTKEMGVRKALGASVPRIVLIMSGAFTKLVLVAFLLAAFPAYWVTNRWLADFAYHVTLGPGTLLAAGFAALILAWATVSYQAVKVAATDPVTALRYE